MDGEPTIGGRPRRFAIRLPHPAPDDGPPPSSLEFDAAEEICRFARPLLITAADRRR